MSSPTPPPSWYSLATALVTVVAVAIAIIPIYCPPTADPWYLPILVAGPCVATITFLDLRLYTFMCLATVTSTWMGLGVGMLIHFIFDVASGGKYNRLWAALLLCPYTFLSSLGMPAAKSKLGRFTLSALVSAFSYVPVGFYAADAYTEAWVTGLAVTFGAVVPWVVLLIFKTLGLIPSPGLPMTKRLPFAAADFFDLLTGYFICARDHNNAIQAQADDFNEVCHAAAKQKIPARLSAVFWNMAGELFSLKDCLLTQELEPGIIAYVWKPLAADFSVLRSEVGIVLRKTARGVPEEADRDLNGRIASCEQLMVDVISDVSRKAVEGSISPLSSTAVVQFYSAVGSILYIAGLTEKYRLAAVAQKEEEERERQEKRDKILSPRAFFDLPSSIWKGIVAWIKKPFFYDIKEKSDILRRFIFPLRFSLTLFAIAFSMIVWGMHSENVRLHGFWAVIPVYVSFLPTAGASLLKGTRRICGTLLGGIAAVICILANPGNKAAFFCEMILVVFLGRLSQFDCRVGYAGYVFSLTWFIVGFGSILVSETQEAMLYNALWRFVFQTCGVLITSFSSCFIFPEFAADKLDRASARMLGAVSDKLVSTLDSFYHQAKALVGNDGCSDDDEAPPPPMSDDREEFGVEGFQSMAERASLLDDAKMETIVFGKILLVHDVTRRVLENQKLFNQVLRDGLVLYSSLVMSAKHLHDPLASQTLSPLLGSIRELSKAIKTSADRIVSCLYDSGSTPGMLEHLPDDVHVKLQECAYNFGAFREEWIEDVMTGGNRLQGMRGTNAVRLYHTVYALAMFAERWNTLESRLHNRNAPVELVDAQPQQQQQQQPEPAQRALMVLRSRSNIVQQ
ncbi:hypothetical protein FOZ62_024363 [Perkinsus olseni]|uniref:Aluminum-activated malate transporter 1 n=2 Tax=Perkinsus olseni TaxID=32597 RepID=A0A7J6PTM8_PEROL|nr:hypothetical protein FOZ62_024363 [Perkinsus olseni]